MVPRNTPITGGGGSTPNNPPIARAGSDISIIDSDDNGSETVTLNGDASSDSDGTIVSYRWKNGATELGSGSEISPSIAVGTHTVTLTVEDDRGWTDSDTVQVIVTSPSGSSGSGGTGSGGTGSGGTGSGGTGSGGTGGGGTGGGSTSGSGLVGNWNFDEGQGTIASDSTGSNHGALVNGPVWESGALRFDGVNDYVDLKKMDIPDGTGMSISIWYKADNFNASDARFLSKANGTSDQDHLWMLSALNGTSLRFRLKTDNQTTTLVSPAGGVIAGSWHHVVATYDGQSMKLYRDGQEIANQAKTGSVDKDPNMGVVIGAQPGDIGSRNFDGLLDDAQIFNRALTITEIQALSGTGPSSGGSGGGTGGSSGNIPPTAEAGVSQTIVDSDDNGVESISLDASGSQDSDGIIVDYSWANEAGTVLSTEKSPSISLGLGTHIITLTVVDNLGATDSDTVAISINKIGGEVCTATSGSSSSSGGGTASPVATAVNSNASSDRQAIDNLAPGQWYEVQGSRMDKVYPGSIPSGDPATIMVAWSGGVYDSNNDRLMVFGGGHTDYAGNEVYAFDINSLAWSRLSNPSAPRDADRYSDGTPTSRHTYDSMKFVPALNSMCSFGVGSRWQIGYPSNVSDCFDVGTGRWFQIPNVPRSSAGPGHRTAYDPNTGLIYHHGGSTGNAGISVFDPSSKKWVATYNGVSWMQVNATAAFDPKRNKMISIGAGEAFVWDIGAGSYTAKPLNTSGANGIVGSQAPGVVYDPVIDRFVAWSGGGSVYTLNMDTLVWSQVSLTNSVRPGPGQSRGTYGRFQYIPSKNLYVAVNETKKNVFFFKLSNGSGTGGGSGGTGSTGGGESCTPENQPPTANAGNDLLVTDADDSGAENVELNGLNSSDIDGSIVSYQWLKNGSEIATGSKPVVSLTTGEHNITLVVTDDYGDTSADTVTVNVKPATIPSSNKAPIANAGPDKTVTDADGDGSESVALSAAGSSDSDGSIVSYNWRDNGKKISSLSEDNVTLSVGEHVLVLTVVDNEGTTGQDTVIVTVESGGTGGGSGSGNVLRVGSSRTYKRPSDAAAVAQTGDTIEIDTELYLDDVVVWRTNGINIKGVGGRPHIKSTKTILYQPGSDKANGQGTWVVKGQDITIDNVEISGTKVTDENGAAVRIEGQNLTIKNSYFHHNENGLLGGGGILTIENTEFAYNGTGDGFTHNMYIDTGDTLILKNSYSHHASIGHNVKSRAQKNYILYNRIEDQDGTASYQIDIPQGGQTFIIGNSIQQGPNNDNPTIIAYGAEGGSKGFNPIRELNVSSNTVVNDHYKGQFLSISGSPTQVIKNNLFVGAGSLGVSLDSSNMKTDNPGFVDRAGFDFHLTGTSPAVDQGYSPGSTSAGYPLTPSYQYVHVASSEARSVAGSSIDYGAFEYGNGGSGGGSNQAPVAAAGNDQTVKDVNGDNVETVDLKDAGSNDPDGNIVKYEWLVAGQNKTGKEVSLALAVGQHIVTLKVTDNDGASSTDTLVVTVQPADTGSSNTAPTAVISVAENAYVSEVVEVSGAKSSDVDGDNLSYTWQLQGPSGSTSSLNKKDGDAVSFTPDVVGGYELTLVVNDGTESSEVVKETVQVSDEAVTEGLVAHWKLDESTGSTATDSVNSFDGGLANGPTWSPGVGHDGGALKFDGKDDYVDLRGMDIPKGTGMTISLWYNADNFATSDARFISKANGVQDSNHLWMLSAYKGTSLRFRLKAGDKTSVLVSPAGNLTTGKWQHVVATYDGSFMRLYRDGVQIASLAKTGSRNEDPGMGVALGAQPQGAGGRHFDGLMDDVRIYNRALSAAEIQAMVDNGSGEGSVNRLPVANAGSDRSISDQDRNGTEDVVLDGRGSVDPDGKIVSHEWTLPGGEVISGETVTVRLASGMKHTIKLVVTDNENATGSDTVVIHVKGKKVHSLVSPTAGSTLKTDKITFTWDDYGDAKESWALQVGTTSGGKEVYKKILDGSVKSHTVYGLPANGNTLFVRLFSRKTATSTWEYTDDTFKTAKLEKPYIYYPARGSRLRTAATFRWKAKGRNVRLWKLYVGSRRGSKNIYGRTLRGSTSNARVTRIPANGRGVWVRLYWKSSSTSPWQRRDYYYKGPKKR